MDIAGIIVAVDGVGAFVGGLLLYKIMLVRYMFLGYAILILITFLFILLFIKKDRGTINIEIASFSKQMKFLLSNRKVIFLSLCGFINTYGNQTCRRCRQYVDGFSENARCGKWNSSVLYLSWNILWSDGCRFPYRNLV
jgi:hypothetical protein